MLTSLLELLELLNSVFTIASFADLSYSHLLAEEEAKLYDESSGHSKPSGVCFSSDGPVLIFTLGPSPSCDRPAPQASMLSARVRIFCIL